MDTCLQFCILLTLLSPKLASACLNGNCRNLAFPSVFFFANKRLVKHNITAVRVPDMDVCELLCYQEPNCVSVNFKGTSSSDGKYRCELNNATHQGRDGQFKDEEGYFYHGADSACDTALCENGGTCQSGFTHKGYQCICPLGFTGEICETDIDECSQGSHDCLPDLAFCTNTVGSYSCSCDSRYEGDGKTSCVVPPGCQSYQILNSADRKETYGGGEECDHDIIGPGWYRFEGAAGKRMATSCTKQDRCNTRVTGWLNGTHPTVAEGQVTRQVCFSFYGNCCHWSTYIKVRNCGSYYVYYLNGVPHCNARYCGTVHD